MAFNKTKRLLIRRGQFVNKGAEAMIRTVQSEISARISGVSFAIPPEAAFAKTRPLALAAGLDVLADGMSRGEKLGRLARRFLRHPMRVGRDMCDRRWLQYDAVVDQVDAIVDVAGYGYGDVWDIQKSVVTLNYLAAARERNIPYVFMPQAWGPFDRLHEQPTYRQLCRHATAFYARDESSQRHLAELLRVDHSAICLAPDIAFRFRGKSREDGRLILSDAGLPDDVSIIVGLSPNQKVYERSYGTGYENAYVKALCEMCSECLRAGAAVVLIPHEIQPSEFGTVDDRLLCSMVAAQFRDPHVVAMTEQYSAEQIKGTIANFDLLIASRFHALVAALSQSIPVAALGWSHKYVELLGAFGLGDFAIGYDKLGTINVHDFVEGLFAQRESLRSQIQSRIGEIQKKVDDTFDSVSAMICRQGTLSSVG